MLKRISITITLLLVVQFASLAQNTSSSVSQTIRLELAAAIEITSLNTMPVDMKFSTVANFNTGVMSGEQSFKVKSNKDFVVNVSTDGAYFSYSGQQGQNPLMPVDNTLFMTVSDNHTGGNVANEFANYNSLTSVPKNLIVNGSYGADQTFAVNYKAKPDISYPSGVYVIGVIYTATQP